MWAVFFAFCATAQACSFGCVAMCSGHSWGPHCGRLCGCGNLAAVALLQSQSSDRTCEDFCKSISDSGSIDECMQTCDSSGHPVILSSDDTGPTSTEQAPSGMSLKCYQNCIEVCGLSENSDCLSLCTSLFCIKPTSAYSHPHQSPTILSDPEVATWILTSLGFVGVSVGVLCCTARKALSKSS